jgi:hypothetical protein
MCCITLLVESRLPESTLTPRRRIPRTIPLSDGEYLTDVEESSSRMSAHGSLDEVVRPVQPSSPVSIATGAPGTLGVFVRVIGQTRPLLLSCSHVIARSGQFGKPFTMLSDDERTIQQPPSGPPPANRVAFLTDVFTTLLPLGQGNNTEDAALAELASGVPASPFPRFDDQIITTVAPSPITRHTPTTLLGAVNRHASGEVLNPSYPPKTLDPVPFVQSATYAGMVYYRSNCAPGDSGGAVVDDQNRLLGIHVGGNSDAGVGVFFPIAEYFRTHNLELVTTL